MKTTCALATFCVLVLASHLAAQGTGCADTKDPDTLFTPNALVDSAHAIGDLAAFADPSRPMVFSVSFSEGDSVAFVRALKQTDAAAAVSLTNYVRHARPRALWAFRIRITGGDAPALTVERSKYCPPVSPEGDVPFATRVRMSIPVVVGTNPSPIETPGSGVTAEGRIVLVEALISVDGRVIVGHVVESTGNSDWDAGMECNMRSLKFEPAKLDGEPIQGVFRSRGQSPRP